jgi:hypothetical protein
MLKDGRAVAFNVLVIDNTGFAPVQEVPQQLFAQFEWRLSKINAVDLQQVEGIQKHGMIIRLAVQLVERRNAILIADNTFAVEIERCGFDLAGS